MSPKQRKFGFFVHDMAGTTILLKRHWDRPSRLRASRPRSLLTITTTITIIPDPRRRCRSGWAIRSISPCRCGCSTVYRRSSFPCLWRRQKSEMLRIHTVCPDKNLYFTEISIGEWGDGYSFANDLMWNMREVGIGTINNFCKAVMVWNPMLDENHAPYRPSRLQHVSGVPSISVQKITRRWLKTAIIMQWAIFQR